MKSLKPNIHAKDEVYNRVLESSEWSKSFNELYLVAYNVLDSNFSERILHDFASRYSEMYFAGAFIERTGVQVQHPSDKGADLYLKDYDCWVEIVNATNGEEGNPNSLVRPENMKAYDYPERKVILRLSSVFSAKADKLKKDIEKGLLNDTQPIIICISGGSLYERLPMYSEDAYPQIAKVVLPLGDLVYWIDTQSKKIVSREFKYKDVVNKSAKDGVSPITTGYFLDENYSHISAVIYSWANAYNPLERTKWGKDFFTIHNPNAKNKLPMGFIKCGKEYPVKADDESFTIGAPIEHDKVG